MFQVGDIVEQTSYCSSVERGEKCKVGRRSDGKLVIIGRINDGGCTCQSLWKLVSRLTVEAFSGSAMVSISNSKEKTMTSIIDKVKLALKTEPNKTLITRGLMTIDDKLTSEGREVLDYVLVQKHGEEMAKIIGSVPVDEKKA